MNWFGDNEHRTSANSQFASWGEIKSTFVAHDESLYRMALLITADAHLAKQSVVNATGLASTAAGVFRDWLTEWAHVATARAAVQAVSEPILAAIQSYSDWICNHASHAVLEEREINALRELDPLAVARDLDPLARAVLVLYGWHHTSITHSAILLRVPRKYVLRAYCHVLQWERELVQPSRQS